MVEEELRSPEHRRKPPSDPLTPSKGYLRPSCARPLGGPRIASAARHRLVWMLAQPLAVLDIALSGCLPSCLLRGTTRFLSPAPEPLRHWACTPPAAPPVPVCLLEAPPTGGTHFESNGVVHAVGAASSTPYTTSRAADCPGFWVHRHRRTLADRQVSITKCMPGSLR
jgi:hypothetical protein